MQKAIYLDVDGVLRDLSGYYSRVSNGGPVTEYSASGFGRFWEANTRTKELTEQFYLGAPVLQGALEAVQHLKTMGHPIKFLTANKKADRPWLETTTIQWLEQNGFQNLGDATIFVSSAGQKKNWLERNDILFDDKVDTINTLTDGVFGVWVQAGLTGDNIKFKKSEFRAKIPILTIRNLREIPFL